MRGYCRVCGELASTSLNSALGSVTSGYQRGDDNVVVIHCECHGWWCVVVGDPRCILIAYVPIGWQPHLTRLLPSWSPHFSLSKVGFGNGKPWV